MSQTALTKPLCVQRAKVGEMGTQGPGVLQHNLGFHKGKGEAGPAPSLPGLLPAPQLRRESLGAGWDGEIRELGCSLQLSSCNQSQRQD